MNEESGLGRLDTLLSAVAQAHGDYAEIGKTVLAAESKYLAEVSRAFDSGVIDAKQLQMIYNQHRDWAATTKLASPSTRWLEHIPYDWQALRQMAARVPERQDGTWRGSTGLADLGSDGPFPGKGAPVAFVLFGNGGTPVYIGFTEFFRNRLVTLDREGLWWESWLAVACADRSDSVEVRRDLVSRFGQPQGEKRIERITAPEHPDADIDRLVRTLPWLRRGWYPTEGQLRRLVEVISEVRRQCEYGFDALADHARAAMAEPSDGSPGSVLDAFMALQEAEPLDTENKLPWLGARPL